MQTIYLLCILLQFIIEGATQPPNWTVPASSSITIASTACDDVTTLRADSGDGSTVLYSLESQSPTGGFTVTDHFSGNKILTCVQGSITAASYEVVVRARHDGGNNLHTDLTLTITFTDLVFAAAPEFVKPSPNDADDDHLIALPETIQAGETVLTLTATDPDTDDSTLTFNMDASAEATRELFEIAGKELKVKDGVVNDYFDAEKDGVVFQYPIVLEVSDGGSSTTLSTAIDVQDVNDNSPEFSGTFTAKIKANVPDGYTVFTITATDSDNTSTNNQVTLSLSEISAFNLDGDKIKVSAGVNFDAKMQSTYTLIVTASDNAPVDPKTTDQDFTVTIKAAAAPEFVKPSPNDADDDHLIALPETIQAGETVLTLTATDADTDDSTLTFNMDASVEATKELFEIDGKELKVKDGVGNDYFDAEKDGVVFQYPIVLQVRDSGGSSTVLSTTINVQDVNDNSPEFSGSFTAEIQANVPDGYTVFTITATDSDRTATNNQVTLFLSDISEFNLDGDKIKVSTGVNFDAKTQSTYTLKVTASDNAPVDPKTTDQDFTVTIKADISECASYPCRNGGTCTDGSNTYTCECVPGYDGNNCDNNINECASNPCQNCGTCYDGIDKYICDCLDGYDGDNCENNIPPTECDNSWLIGVAVSGWASFAVLLVVFIIFQVRKGQGFKESGHTQAVKVEEQLENGDRDKYMTLQHRVSYVNSSAEYETLEPDTVNTTSN